MKEIMEAKIMRVQPIKGNITFKSGYPTFGFGHLSKTVDNDENKITFKGSPWNRDCRKHIPTGEELGPRKPRIPSLNHAVYRHVDMLGNVIDIQA